MHLLISDIQWETDGEPLDECGLPESVLVLDVPADIASDETLQESLDSQLSDQFGFLHEGFVHQVFDGTNNFPNKLGVFTFQN